MTVNRVIKIIIDEHPPSASTCTPYAHLMLSSTLLSNIPAQKKLKIAPIGF